MHIRGRLLFGHAIVSLASIASCFDNQLRFLRINSIDYFDVAIVFRLILLKIEFADADYNAIYGQLLLLLLNLREITIWHHFIWGGTVADVVWVIAGAVGCVI